VKMQSYVEILSRSCGSPRCFGVPSAEIPAPPNAVQLVPKRRKTAFDHLLEQIEPSQTLSFSSSASLEVQLAEYKLVDKTHLSVTQWWQQHAAELDKIASLALMLVNIPATESQCERRFHGLAPSRATPVLFSA
jgi:hypothetical protein